MKAFNTPQELFKVWKRIKKYPNVVGIDGDLRPKIINGIEHPDILSIRIYVSKKVPLEQFKSLSLFKRFFRLFRKNPSLTKKDLLPNSINGFPVDVVEIGKIYSRSICAERPLPVGKKSTTKRYRPLYAGTSSTHYQSTACTLNNVFIDKSTNKLLLASNAHCYALENKAKIGDPILQPSPYDGGTLSDQVGEFYKGVSIHFTKYSCPFRNFLFKISKLFKREVFNRVDISFATFKCNYHPICDPIKYLCGMRILFLGTITGKREAQIGETVQKVGRTTGKTLGKVISTSWTGNVEYSRGRATFTDCILIEGRGFSAGGDSGSPILSLNNEYLGALFAGSENYTVACKISNIEKESNTELVIPPESKRIKGRRENRK